MKTLLTRLSLAVVLATGTATSTYSGGFIDVNDATAWRTGTGAGANSSVSYGFDYSTLGVPQAPGTSNTQGMILRANVNSGAAAVQGITVSPNGVSLTGDYVVRALVWANSYGGWTTGAAVSGSTGSSQMLGLGVGYTGGTQWRGGSAATGAPGGGTGIWFAAAGDGGFGGASNTIRDYSAFTGSGQTLANFVTNTAAYYATSVSGSVPQDNNNPYYQTAFPGAIVNTINGGTWASVQGQTLLTGTITNGVAGMAWREFTIERTGSSVTWTIDSTPIVTLSGTALNGVSPDGGMSITYFDPTSSVAAVDKVFGLVARVEVIPEPSTCALALAGLGVIARSLWRRHRRR